MVLQNKSKLKFLHKFLSNPARVIVCSFAFLILTGALVLMLPMCAKSGQASTFADALFTAVSATCVTGLVVVDTFTHFTVLGQVVILFLIQLGGLGLVTFATFFNILIRKKIGLKTLQVAKESVSSGSLSDIGHLLKVVFVATILFELFGAVLLSTVFVPEFGAGGIFISVFLAISAYCNAGFDILGFLGEYSSLTFFNDNPVVLFTIMGLIICGGLGFIVWQDIYANIRDRSKRLHLHTKLVLIVSGILIVLGTVMFAIFEWNNTKTIGNMSFSDKMLNSMFMSVSTRTAGFNTIPVEDMFGITKLFSIMLMFIGAAPGSTGGGIKVTTFLVIIMTVISVILGKNETTIAKRRLDKAVVYKALAVVFMAFVAVLISTSTIFFTSHSGVSFKEIDSLFEAVSAFGTVGLSSGVTGLANGASRFVLILTMFIGRVGPVSLALSLAMKNENKSTVLPEAKIMVG